MWQIYVYGDVDLFWTVLNGVSAFFSNTGLLNSAALVGGLIGLTVVLLGHSTYSTDIGSTMKMAGIWGLLVSALFITASVSVTDVYTSRIRTIDNVPILVAAPASLFTTGAWKIAQIEDTAFQSTSGSYLTVSQNGIVQPLQILLSLYNNNFAVAQDPYLYRTLGQVLTDCSQGGLITRGASGIDGSPDVISYLTANLRQTGFTSIYNAANPTGTVQSCAYAATYLSTGFDNYLSGTGSQYVAGKPIKNIISNGVPNSSGTNAAGTSYSIADYDNVFGTLMSSLTGLQQNSSQSAKNILSAQTVDYTLNCLQQEGQIASGKNCAYAGLITADNITQMQNEMVMSGNVWQKVMFSTMSVMQYLFFALGPITFILAILLPHHSLKMISGYLIFGAWTSSFLMFSAPMSYFLQSQVISAIKATIESGHGLNLMNYGSSVQAITTNLAIASDLMASTPLIALAILSGSFFSLNSIASKMSGEAHSDPSLVSNKIASNAAMSQGTPSQSFNPNSGLSISSGATGVKVAAQYSGSQSLSSLQQHGVKEASGTKEAITYKDSEGNTHKVSVAQATNFSEAYGRDLGAALNATGVAASNALAASAGFNDIQSAVQKANPKATNDDMNGAVTATVAKIMMSKDADWVTKMNGDYATPETIKTGDKSKIDAEKKSFQNAAKAETQSTAMRRDAAFVGMIAATATTATVSAASAGGKMIPGVSGAGRAAEIAASSLVGSVNQGAIDSSKISFGKSMGLSESDSRELVVANDISKSVTGDKAKEYSRTGAFSIGATEIASNSFATEKDLNAIAQDFQDPVNSQSKQDGYSNSEILKQSNPDAYNSAMRQIGILKNNPDKVLVGALVNAVNTGVAKFNSVKESTPISANSYSGMTQSVDQQVDKSFGEVSIDTKQKAGGDGVTVGTYTPSLNSEQKQWTSGVAGFSASTSAAIMKPGDTKSSQKDLTKNPYPSSEKSDKVTGD